MTNISRQRVYVKETLLQNRPLFQAICPGSLWARDNRWLLSRVQRLAGPAGGQGPFVPVGSTNRDKRGIKPGQKVRVAFCPGWNHQPGQKDPLLSRLVSPTGTKGLGPPADPASRWTRDKSHLLSRAQRLPGQMAWNQGLFCSSELLLEVDILDTDVASMVGRGAT